jgi:hypothetical protein
MIPARLFRTANLSKPASLLEGVDKRYFKEMSFKRGYGLISSGGVRTQIGGKGLAYVDM